MAVGSTVLQNMEETLQRLACTATHGTAFSIAFIPAGTMVAVCGFVVALDSAASVVVLENAAGDNFFVHKQRSAGSTIVIEFDHPFITDGLGIVFAGGTVREWSIWYKVLPS